eukprot:m51a1_g4561 hypothetical protein (538) ;mRNA; f:117070-119186
MNTFQTISLMVLISLLNVGIWSNYDTPGVVAPQMEAEWNYTKANLGQAYSLYSFPNLIIPIAYGALMDRAGPVYGVPIFLMLSTLFVTAASITIWLSAGNILVFLGARIVMGLGGEFVMLCQYAATSKWFPINRLCVANALIMIVGMVALAGLFNVFPMIAQKWSLNYAFGYSAVTSVVALALSIVYVVFHIRQSKKPDCDKTHSDKGVQAEMDDLESGVPAEDESADLVPHDASGRRMSNSNDDFNKDDDNSEDEEEDDDEEVEVEISSAPLNEPENVRPSMDVVIERGRGDEIAKPLNYHAKWNLTERAAACKAPFLAGWLMFRRFPAIYWLLTICCGFNVGIVQTFIVFSTDLLVEKWKIEPATAARFTSIIVSTPIVFSLPLGVVIDKYGHRITGLVGCSGLLVVAYAALAFLPGSVHVSVAVIMMFLQGLVFSFIPTVEGSAFTLACPHGLLSTGMGISFVVNMLTTTVFPLVIGYLFDWKKSYVPGLIVLMVSSAFSLAAGVLAIYLDRKAPEQGMEQLQKPSTGLVVAHH